MSVPMLIVLVLVGVIVNALILLAKYTAGGRR